MKTICIIISLFLLTLLKLPASSQSVKSLFCGKVQTESRKPIVCSIKELSECNWQITTSDNRFIVKSFRLTIVSFDQYAALQEILVEGNEIPAEFREEITLRSKSILMEYIKVSAPDSTMRSINPISVKIGH